MVAQVYFAVCRQRVKIGISTNVMARLASLASKEGAPLRLLATMDGWRGMEKRVHYLLREHHVEGEWFRDCDQLRDAITDMVHNGLPMPGDDPSDWFVEAVKTLGKDAGLHLHYITGYPERSCYYYAKGEREPPADFLRALFRSPQGLPFFRAFMHGCEAEWWRDLEQSEQRAISAETRLRKFKEAIDNIE